MPRTAFKRKTYRPRKRLSKRGAVVSARRATKRKFIPVGLPNSQTVRLRWKGYVSLDPTSTAAATNVYAANGMYNVDITSLGEHVPLWYNEWMNFYQHYTVIGSKMTVMVAATASSANDCLVGIGIGSTSSAVTSLDYWPNQRRTKMKSIANIYAKSNCTVTNKVSMNKYFKRKVLQDDQYQGVTNGNPNEGVFYHLFAQNFGSATDSPPVRCSVVIDYIAVLRETKEIIPST